MYGVGALVSLRGLVTVLRNKRRQMDRKTSLIKHREEMVSALIIKVEEILNWAEGNLV